jgi:cell division protein FtsL
MKRILVAVLMLVFASVSIAVALDIYQVTGPVTEVKDNMVTVKKGKENFQIAIDKDTKTTGDLKVGSKVTIKYQMKATAIEVKDSGKKDVKKEEKPAETKDTKKK